VLRVLPAYQLRPYVRLIAVIICTTLAGVHISAQAISLSGHLNLVWADPELQLYLSNDEGTVTRLRLDSSVRLPYAELLRMNGQLVTVTGVETESASPGPEVSQWFQVQHIDQVRPDATASGASSTLITGAQPWVTILCQYPDVPVTPNINPYLRIFTDSSYPSLDEYWREVSYNSINLTGSAALPTWFTLPQPHAYYIDNASRLATDCTAVANASVNFANYVGINLVFNESVRAVGPGYAFGGGLTMTLNGVTKMWRMVWYGLTTPYLNSLFAGMAHETGHGFGLPHSSGPYSQVYDSKWDVMSNSFVSYDLTAQVWNPEGTISYHKDLDGWIPPSRKYTAPSNSTATISLERLTRPVSGSNYLMAQIPIAGSATHFYTVELRQLVGHDAGVPGSAVLIHEVLTTRGEPAHVVDPDNDGDPNCCGALWTPGKTFLDATNGVAVTVNSIDASSASVTVSLGSWYVRRFTHGGGGGTITVQTSGNWVATASASWITLGVTSGTGTATVAFTVAPTAGSRHGTITIAGQTFEILEGGGAIADLDGDDKTDLIVYRPATGIWYSLLSSTGSSTYVAYQWGVDTDVPVAGDYDGDGKVDVAVYRPATGIWYILMSTTNFTNYIAYQWGVSTDAPVPADYDGDGKTDVAVYRPATGIWYVLRSSTNSTTYASYQWGVSTDVPVPADYDGDGKTDVAIYRPATGIWYILLSTTNSSSYLSYQWGVNTDIPVSADYDGDGKVDVAVYRPATGVWYILQSSTNSTTYVAYQWGVNTDVPVSGDYDGDGKADVAIYRPATGIWYVLLSSSNFSTYVSYQWGVSTDIPVNKRP
jgi:M6 family metalloprotease-like protein